MGSRYLFALLVVFLEHHLSRGDYRRALPPGWSPPASHNGAGSPRPHPPVKTVAQEASLERVYAGRFSDDDAARKDRIWQEIARFLQRFVPEDAVVLDLACDRGDFIRNIRGRERWASDLRDVSEHLPADIGFVHSDGLSLADRLPADHFDVVFMSNYLEHLASGDAVVKQPEVVRDLLRPGGRVIVLQPNIRSPATATGISSTTRRR